MFWPSLEELLFVGFVAVMCSSLVVSAAHTPQLSPSAPACYSLPDSPQQNEVDNKVLQFQLCPPAWLWKSPELKFHAVALSQAGAQKLKEFLHMWAWSKTERFGSSKFEPRALKEEIRTFLFSSRTK